MGHQHIYDEHDLCFECDKPKPKSKAELMRETRQRRRNAGLVEFRCWIHPDDKPLLGRLAQDLSRAISGAVVNDLESG